MYKRRKQLKDCSVRHIKRIASIEAQNEILALNFQSNTEPVIKPNHVINDIDNEPNLQTSSLSFDADSEEYPNPSFSNRPDSPMSWTDDRPLSSVSSLNEDLDSPSPTPENHENRILRKPFPINEKLSNWAVKNNITSTALSELLKILNEEGHKLPMDSRSLLNTPRTTLIREIVNGHYWHAGIRTSLSKKLYITDHIGPSVIYLSIGFDGLPLAKSSNSCLWPILGKVVNIPGETPFLIGAYHGHEKPIDANLYMSDFISEMEELSETGLLLNGKLFQVKIKFIVCDAPAKSFVLYVKGHTGYGSCTKCTVHGNHLRRSVYFSNSSEARKRTDSDFEKQSDKNYHVGKTDLTKIPGLGLVTNVPLDYMHLVCLGVTRKLMKLWLFGDKRNKSRKPIFKIDGPVKVDEMSTLLVNIKSYVPTEFSRKPRCLKEVKHWKATEYRQVLLYTGVVVFKDFLAPSVYLNFLSLHVAIRILCSSDLYSNHLDYANDLLDHFVIAFGLIYGKHNISHNVHGLRHLAEDVANFGSLDNFSAFEFENEMQFLKRNIRKAEKPLQQLCRRYSERESVSRTGTTTIGSQMTAGLHNEGPIMEHCTTSQYKILNFQSCRLNTKKEADSCCLLRDETVVMVSNITKTVHGKLVVIGQRFKNKEEVYVKPCKSSLLQTFLVSNISPELEMWPVDMVIKKMFKLPQKNNKYVVIPLIHQE